MNQELLEKKAWGHQLINIVAEKHDLNKDDVYWNLSKYLGRKESLCHFARMGDRETDQAIGALIRMNKRKNGEVHKRGITKQKLPTQTLPASEIKRLVATLPKRKKLPLFERISIRFKNFIRGEKYHSKLTRHK